MSIENVRTIIGNINARDGVYVDDLSFKNNGQLIMTGEINAHLCSIKHNCEWLKYIMTFKGIVYQAILELDNFERLYPTTDNITEKEDSEILQHVASNTSQKANGYKHYIIFTYDYILEVVCKHFDFKIISNR